MYKTIITGLLGMMCFTSTYAICIDAAVIVQLDIHGKSGGISQQDATVNQQQDPNCVIVHARADVPEADNRMTVAEIIGKNIAISKIIQKEVVVPDAAFSNPIR